MSYLDIGFSSRKSCLNQQVWNDLRSRGRERSLGSVTSVTDINKGLKWRLHPSCIGTVATSPKETYAVFSTCQIEVPLRLNQMAMYAARLYAQTRYPNVHAHKSLSS